ncbi:MAG: hypothetical protein QW201_00995, partial [Thermoproteota archaeon]
MSQIKFCKRCESRMILKRDGTQLSFVCSKCGYSEPVKRIVKPLEKRKTKSSIKVIGKEGADLKP